MITFTDGQIVRMFDLCAEIAAIRKELPRPPIVSAEVKLEIARHLRESVEKHGDTVSELIELFDDARLRYQAALTIEPLDNRR